MSVISPGSVFSCFKVTNRPTVGHMFLRVTKEFPCRSFSFLSYLGTTGVLSATTVSPGSSNSEATTSIGESGETGAEIITGTTEGISGRTLEAKSAPTEATTFPGGSGATQAGPTGGISAVAPATTVARGSFSTAATASPGASGMTGVTTTA
ncbi:mucin-19-like, partial [Piliocolobus tephrosceles]|uniref:mucin-19-like n=1 Tax=Piliocolobus tephrosceles TaxID=591936 RepID=UPI000E6B2F1D